MQKLLSYSFFSLDIFCTPFIHGPTDTQLFTFVINHNDQYLSIPFQKCQKILEKTHIYRDFCITFYNEFFLMRWNWGSIETTVFLEREWNSRLFKLMAQQLVKRKEVKESPVFPIYGNLEGLLQKSFSLKVISGYNWIQCWSESMINLNTK